MKNRKVIITRVSNTCLAAFSSVPFMIGHAFLESAFVEYVCPEGHVTEKLVKIVSSKNTFQPLIEKQRCGHIAMNTDGSKASECEHRAEYEGYADEEFGFLAKMGIG
jgi:hypothetical protein